MKQWLRRFGYLIFLIFWLMIMCFPTCAFTLAMREQIQLGSHEGSHLRIFLIVEPEADGIGLEVTRPSIGSNCLKTSVSYFFWEGGERGQNVSYCQCFDPETDAPLPIEQDNCR